ncbi:restriction endonuclease subunit S [Pseudomonas fulva]|uniref:restriction endonuclease subunit S n=1 Tax=Pseudomonas fulva TaxID=47880 RepID=UPI002B1E5A68|nr:restriction endonuclease subunit S [Pseudomonas fulva]
MSHYKPYPVYKDSRVEWLGRVPEHWEALTLRRVVAAVKTGGTPTTESPSTEISDGIAWYTPGDFGNEMVLEASEKRVSQTAISTGDVKVFPAGSILVVSIGATLGKVGFVAEEVSANQQINVVIPNARVDGYFLAYSLSVKTEAMWYLANAATIGIMNQEKTKEIWLAIPSIGEQKLIATHLDRETARIDALVEKKTRFIELLREKRQALIINAITKGLDPNVRMKDSGVEWLGEVPEHWNVLQLRHTARLESGHTPSRSKPEYWVDCTIPWFTLADVWQVRSGEQKYVSETSEKVSQLGLENSSARLLPAGSVFLSRTASVGFPGIMAVDMATSQDFAVWTCTSELFNEYLYYVLLGMKPDFDRLMMGSTHKTIYMPDIEAIRLALPPLDEQRGIVSALSGQLGRFKIVINKTERSIELLKERRSALITAAVTGQIDLREAV